jgi:hypothetical protein
MNYSSLNQITAANVADLKPVWAWDSGKSGRTWQTRPLMIGGLLYFTSHGTPDGIVVGDAEVAPRRVAAMVNNSCGDKPSVIVMSACFSGQFVPVLARDHRIVITAARADRTSFGCGEMDQFTFFDDCFLRALPLGSDFAGLGDLIKQCVTAREKEVKAEPPSEPQVSIGSKVTFTLRWK